MKEKKYNTSTIVISVKFSDAGKVYYFDPVGTDFIAGDGVIVETAKGVECGKVVAGNHAVPDSGIVQPLKQIIRKATEKDYDQIRKNTENEKKAFEFCKKKIEERGMDMHLVGVEYTFDARKIVFYFTADDRVDFRELVKDLASEYRARIELRQIGVRDEAKKIGGLASCGRPCCCNSFMGDFQPVSIKMAKEQNLSLSPTKISGLCGRLMCCLAFENDFYSDIHKITPRVGSMVETVDGKMEVVEVNVLTEKVKVKAELPDGTFDIRVYNLNEVRRAKGGRPKKEVQDEDVSDDIKAILD